MPENDDFPALDEKLAERLSSLDETEALQRADALRAGLTTTNSTRKTPDCSRPSPRTRMRSHLPSRRRRCWPSWAGRTWASPRW